MQITPTKFKTVDFVLQKSNGNEWWDRERGQRKETEDPVPIFESNFDQSSNILVLMFPLWKIGFLILT